VLEDCVGYPPRARLNARLSSPNLLMWNGNASYGRNGEGRKERHVVGDCACGADVGHQKGFRLNLRTAISRNTFPN
jgi:hypothetical protein